MILRHLYSLQGQCYSDTGKVITLNINVLIYIYTRGDGVATLDIFAIRRMTLKSNVKELLSVCPTKPIQGNLIESSSHPNLRPPRETVGT